ncbi:MAG TPA: site-specific integrase [Candidatus Dojkabacteria bacterium]|nr:site-specific integrase [Candidatus Dojkabacteria bacterium]
MKDHIQGAYDWDEIQSILDVAKKDNERNFVLLMTLAYTGRRIVEIVGREKERETKIKRDGKEYTCKKYRNHGLRPMDIDFRRDLIRFEIAKQFQKGSRYHKHRIVKVNKYVIEHLWEFVENNHIKPNDRIFKLTPERVGQIVKKYCEKAQVYNKERLVHAFRHGFALHFLEVSEDDPYAIVNLKESLCHSSLDITTEYLKYRKKKNETIDKL